MKPVDYIVICLTLVIGIVICIPLMKSTGYDGERAKLIGGLIASSIAIISMYVGARLSDKD
jgi:hypothetical protein